MEPLAPTLHPQPDENGNPLLIEAPSAPSDAAAWLDPDASATYSATHGGELPAALNDVAFTSEKFEGKAVKAAMMRLAKFREPPLPVTQKRFTSGLVVARARRSLLGRSPLEPLCGR